MLSIDYVFLGVIAVCAIVLFTPFAPAVLRYVAIFVVFASACLSLVGVIVIHRLAWDQPKPRHFGSDAPEHRYFADGAFAAQRAAWRFIPGIFFSGLVLTGAAVQGVARRKT